MRLMIVLLFLLVASCGSLSCEDYAEQLDFAVSSSVDTLGHYRLSSGALVGGTLIDADVLESDSDETYVQYALTFAGVEKEGVLYWYAPKDLLVEEGFPYEIGSFYLIDLSLIKRSGYHSGMFADSTLTLLEKMDCS